MKDIVIIIISLLLGCSIGLFIQFRAMFFNMVETPSLIITVYLFPFLTVYGSLLIVSFLFEALDEYEKNKPRGE